MFKNQILTETLEKRNNKVEKRRQAVIDYLNKYRYDEDNGEPATHQSYGTLIQGRFSLPKNVAKDFMHIYCEALNCGIYDFSILEIQKEYSPIIVDIDLKASNNNQRLYNNDLILDIIKKYVNVINTYLDIPKDYYFKISLFEKDEPTKNGEIIKDGFHIIFSDICANTKIRHIIRDKVVKMCEEDNTFKDFEDEPKTIIDKAVVSSNGWFIYGCKKPNGHLYKLTKIYNMDLNLIYDHKKGIEYDKEGNENKGEFSDADIAKIFSLRYKKKKYDRKTETPLKEDFNIEEQEREQEKPKYINTTNEETEYKDIKILKSFSKCLTDFNRFGDYSGWFKLCASLKTANEEYDDEDLYELFHEISIKSPKYDKKAGNKICRRLWNSLKEDKNKMSLGSFFKWCEEDNIELYEKYCLKYKMLRYKEIEARMKNEKQEEKQKRKEQKQQEKIQNSKLTNDELPTSILQEIEERKQKGLPYMFEDEAYQIIKKEFEEYHFKLYNPFSYIRLEHLKNNLNDSSMPQRLTYASIEKMYTDKWIKCIQIVGKDPKQIKEHKIKFITKWLEDDKKLSYEKMMFQPNPEGENDKVYNLFSGFDNKTNEVITELNPIIKEYLDHLCFNVGGSDFILSWLHHIITKPYKKTNVALVFYSKTEGSGKNTAIELFREIIGNKYVGHFNKLEDMEKEFNEHLANKFIIYADEIKAKAIDLADQLKCIITQNFKNINAKFKDVLKFEDFTNYCFTTNNELAFRVSESDRRFYMIDVKEQQLKEVICSTGKSLNTEIYALLKNKEEMRKLFSYIYNLKPKYDQITEQGAPMTPYKARVIAHSLIAYMHLLYFDPKRISYRDEINYIQSTQLYEISKEHGAKHKVPHTYSPKVFGLDMKKIFDTKQVRGCVCYIIPKLSILKQKLKEFNINFYEGLGTDEINYEDDDEKELTKNDLDV